MKYNINKNYNIENKKAQMKIQQMAFMLVAVMLFFALVGLLVFTVVISGLKDKATNLENRNALLLVSKIANSPEFSCGNAFSSGRASCVDSDKVMALKMSAEKYKNFWGDVSNIEIFKIYSPERKTEKECTLGNYPEDCNTIRLFDDKTGEAKSNFVALCRKENENGWIYDKCELAKITVSYKGLQ